MGPETGPSWLQMEPSVRRRTLEKRAFRMGGVSKMGLLARSFGGDGAKMTAEVACVEGRCEEEDAGLDTGEKSFWERRAKVAKTALSGTGDAGRQRRRRGPPKSDLTNGRSALGLGWSSVGAQGGMAWGLALLAAPTRGAAQD